MTQKNEKVKSYYKFHTPVCITERLAKQGLLDLSGCLTWLKLVFCGTLIFLFIVIRLSGEATAVVKFLIGQSLPSKICFLGKAVSERYHFMENLHRSDRPYKTGLVFKEGF